MTASNLQDIEKLAEYLANVRDELAGCVQLMQERMRAVQAEHTPRIRQLVRLAARNRAILRAAIEGHPELFRRPKTIVAHGLRIGYVKQRGKVEIVDEEATVARIRKQLPEEQAVLLIRVRESVDKNAVGDLKVDDLKRLGIRVTDDSEVVVIKSVDSEVEKLVAALLKDSEHVEVEVEVEESAA